MDPFKYIYQNQAAAYQNMIRVEDADGNLLPAIQKSIRVKGRVVLDLGAGTGRLASLLAPVARSVISLELEHAMLAENQGQQVTNQRSSPLVQADMHSLPFRGQSCDLTSAGWAIGHFCGWYPADWKIHVQQVISEMARVTKPGGYLLILETMGTGTNLPAPPNASLAEYYRQLVDNWGFEKQIIATDYQFSSAVEAATALEFFFGRELAERIRRNNWARVPEWTGVWSRPVL
jgi:ubiquinone/menaquinone biosynthesis C-methylase UbiE